MQLRSGLTAMCLLMSVSSTALAAAATPDGARRITTALQAYLGKEPGVVTVTPAAEAYTATIDFAPLLAKIPAKGATVSIDPIVLKLEDQGGGKWQVSQDQAISFTAKSPGTLDFLLKADKIAGTGIFDESITAFLSSSTDITGFALDETITTPGPTATHVAYTVPTTHYESEAKPAGDGAVDVTSRVTMSGLAETINIPASPGMAMPLDINVNIASASQESTVKGLRGKAITDLIAWLVAHPSPEAIKAEQAALKTLLRAGLPVFENVSASATLQNIGVTTPAGPAFVAKASVDVSLNGAVADGMFREKIALSGLMLPPGLAPPWAESLVPTGTTLDFAVSGFDLAKPAAILLDNLDLNHEPPLKPEIEQQLQQAVMPKGIVTITLGPSSIIGKVAELDAEGGMTAGPMAMPAGQATVKVKGLDQVMEVIKQAPAEMGLGKAAPMFIVAKGMAKPTADGGLEWKIESTPTGGVLVNGTDLSKM